MQYSELGKSTQAILSLCHEIGFGQLTDLNVSDGELHTTVQTRRHESLLLNRPSAPPRGGTGGDFSLHQQQEALVREALRRRQCRITRLEIQNGLPAQVYFEEVVPII